MKCAFLIIMVLLATATSTTPATVPESVSKIPASIGRGLTRLMARTTAVAGPDAALHGEKMAKGCVSQEYCEKKKKVCMKACVAARAAMVDKNSAPGKCFVKCKKCVPDC